MLWADEDHNNKNNNNGNTDSDNVRVQNAGHKKKHRISLVQCNCIKKKNMAMLKYTLSM